MRVRLQPKASRNAVLGEKEGRVRIAVTAAPVGGAANKALLRFLAKQLGVSRGSVSMAAGMKSRDKTLNVAGMTADELRSLVERISV